MGHEAHPRFSGHQEAHSPAGIPVKLKGQGNAELREAIVKLKEEFVKAREEEEERRLDAELETSGRGRGGRGDLGSTLSDKETKKLIQGMQERLDSVQERMKASKQELKKEDSARPA